MEFTHMNGCCQAKVLCEFGGGESSDPKADFIIGFDWENDDKLSLEEAVAAVDERLKTMKRVGTPKIIFATTTSNQPLAEKLLTQLGFYTSKKASTTSGNRKLRAWFLPLEEYKGKK